MTRFSIAKQRTTLFGGHDHLLDHHIGQPHSEERCLDELRLVGAHDEWLLIAVDAPGLDRIVRALTAVPHGLADCTAEWHGPDNVVLRLGDATLAISTLAPHNAMAWAMRANTRT
ncbi:hypothetical protein [Nocardia australiensis]|uniref:hypothetical protein n=1 Tax=Nocardia australiensis TaxID=2887191 RepID=UPI001D1532FC|nr:hypothetical protein [Nocardia australiensis]